MCICVCVWVVCPKRGTDDDDDDDDDVREIDEISLRRKQVCTIFYVYVCVYAYVCGQFVRNVGPMMMMMVFVKLTKFLCEESRHVLFFMCMYVCMRMCVSGLCETWGR